MPFNSRLLASDAWSHNSIRSIQSGPGPNMLCEAMVAQTHYDICVQQVVQSFQGRQVHHILPFLDFWPFNPDTERLHRFVLFCLAFMAARSFEDSAQEQLLITIQEKYRKNNQVL